MDQCDSTHWWKSINEMTRSHPSRCRVVRERTMHSINQQYDDEIDNQSRVLALLRSKSRSIFQWKQSRADRCNRWGYQSFMTSSVNRCPVETKGRIIPIDHGSYTLDFLRASSVQSMHTKEDTLSKTISSPLIHLIADQKRSGETRSPFARSTNRACSVTT